MSKNTDTKFLDLKNCKECSHYNDCEYLKNIYAPLDTIPLFNGGWLIKGAIKAVIETAIAPYCTKSKKISLVFEDSNQN